MGRMWNLKERRDCHVGVPVRLAAIPNFVLVLSIEGKRLDERSWGEMARLLSGEVLVVFWVLLLAIHSRFSSAYDSFHFPFLPHSIGSSTDREQALISILKSS